MVLRELAWERWQQLQWQKKHKQKPFLLLNEFVGVLKWSVEGDMDANLFNVWRGLSQRIGERVCNWLIDCHVACRISYQIILLPHFCLVGIIHSSQVDLVAHILSFQIHISKYLFPLELSITDKFFFKDLWVWVISAIKP